MPVEDALELLVEVLDGRRAQLMEHAPHRDAIAGVRIALCGPGGPPLPRCTLSCAVRSLLGVLRQTHHRHGDDRVGQDLASGAQSRLGSCHLIATSAMATRSSRSGRGVWRMESRAMVQAPGMPEARNTLGATHPQSQRPARDVVITLGSGGDVKPHARRASLGRHLRVYSGVEAGDPGEQGRRRSGA